MEELRHTLARTECIFAARARVQMAPEWLRKRGFERNLSATAEALERFVTQAEAKELDGFAMVLPAAYGRSVPALARTVNQVLRGLDARNPSKDGCFERSIEQPQWRFRFMGKELFLLTIAPCYPSTHARYGFGARSTFLIFQPDSAFARRVPPGAAVIGHAIRDRIRIAYAAANRTYDLALSCSRCEAHRFVKPLKLRASPVRWWEY